jgi:hypothetical protein
LILPLNLPELLCYEQQDFGNLRKFRPIMKFANVSYRGILHYGFARSDEVLMLHPDCRRIILRGRRLGH